MVSDARNLGTKYPGSRSFAHIGEYTLKLEVHPV